MFGTHGRFGRLTRWSILLWTMLPLLGCGATLQAEDTATTASLQRARQLYDAKQFQQARDKAAEVLPKAGQNPQALYLHGLALMQLGQYDQAKDELQKARQIDPLLLFAKDKAEFEAAWKTIGDHTKTAGPTTVATPPGAAPAAKPGAAAPKDAKAPAPAPTPAPTTGPAAVTSTDPIVRTIAAEGPVVGDFSGQNVLAGEQRKAVDKAVASLAARNLSLKFVVLKAGANVQTEAKRLFGEAKLKENAVVVAGAPGGKVAAYSPLMTPAALATAVSNALSTVPADAPLVRRMILASTFLGTKLQAPPPTPEAPKPPVKPAAPTPPPPPAPHLPTPVIVGAAVGGAVLGILLWLLVARLLARRRLSRGFELAAPHLKQVSGLLAAVLAELLRRHDRQAAAAHAAAELAYHEAETMMAEAAADNTGDIARVERAVRLLDEAAGKLSGAQAALSTAPERKPGPVYHCYFTARPLLDRYDGDLVRLKQGDREALVMVARPVGDRIRRGEVPEVRAVDLGGKPLHWARVPEFDPVNDLYWSQRFGVHFARPTGLQEVFFDDPDGRVFVDLNDRPDYTLDLDKG